MTDFHVHTNFCDGRDSPEDMVLAGIQKGLKKIGIVVHSYVSFDPNSCIPLEKVDDYVYEISLLKKKYSDKIDIFCGIEADLYSSQDTGPFDYVIGSAHYLKHDGRYKAVDSSPEILSEMIDENYGGDFYACAEDYYKTLECLADKKPDIIGHFDLIKKFASNLNIFIDPLNERYRKAWQTAADVLLKLGVPFEVNTGGILRGCTNEPYPAPDIAEYIKTHGGKLILSSDAHKKEDVAALFDKWEKLL